MPLRVSASNVLLSASVNLTPLLPLPVMVLPATTLPWLFVIQAFDVSKTAIPEPLGRPRPHLRGGVCESDHRQQRGRPQRHGALEGARRRRHRQRSARHHAVPRGDACGHPGEQCA